MLKSIVINVNKNSCRRIGNFRAPSVPHPPQFNPKGPLLCRPKSLGSTQKPPWFNLPFSSTHPSIQHQKPFSSTPKDRQFSNNNPSVQHTPQFSTPLSSTYGMLHTSQFNTPLSSTPKNKPKSMNK